MKAKRIVLILLGILLISILVFFAVDLYHYSKDKSPYRTLFIPRLEISVLEITYLSGDKTDMNAKMLIHSPLPFNIAADSLQYKIYISGVEVVKSTYAKSVNLKKWDSTWIDLPVTVFGDKLLTTLDKADLQGRDSLVYRIHTTFYAHIPFKKKFDIDVEKLMQRLYIPTTRLEKVEYDSLSFKGVTLHINMMVGNKNKFPFRFKDLKYKFNVATYPWVYGAKWGAINIKQQDSTRLILPLRISFTDIFKSLGPLIRKGGGVGYKFGMDLKLVSENNVLKNSKVMVTDAGTLKEFRKFVKEEKNRQKEKKKKQKERKKSHK